MYDDGAQFLGTSTAGHAFFPNGYAQFSCNSTAGNGSFNAPESFGDNSTAGNGTFTCNGGGVVSFADNSNAGSGTFTVNDNGGVWFSGASSAANATLIANGGDPNGDCKIQFSGDSTGGFARVELFDNGYLAVLEDNLTIGSLEGTGNVFLDDSGPSGHTLTVGSNNLSTTFSGAIQDRGSWRVGFLAKIGSGILTFEGRQTNDYLADYIGLILVNGSIINLNFTGPPDVIASLEVDGVPQPPGIYGSATSGAANPLPEFTGPGTVQVQTGPSPTPTPTPTATPSPTATPAPTVQVTVQTTPAGLAFSVDGTTYSTTQTFSWVRGSSHTIATTSPQSGGTGVQYAWTRWSDNGAISHNVAPTTNKTYTATFRTQYYLTMTHGTGGTVSPASGWKNSGTAVSITATKASGYSFSGWTGSGAGSYSGMNNPASITMNGPITETASFTQNPVQVTVQTNLAGLSFSVDGTTYTSAQTFSWEPGSSHTIATTSPQNGATGVRYVWTSWTGGGAISHIVTPTTNKTYTANFNTQYFLTMSHGTGGTVTPASAWKNSGTVVSIHATPANGYSFTNWTGTGTGSFTGATNPASITMGSPITETATFQGVVPTPTPSPSPTPTPTPTPACQTPTALSQVLSTSQNTPRALTLDGTDPVYLASQLTYTVTQAPTNGVLTGSGRFLTYTPNPGYIGTDIFWFRVTNPCGNTSAPASVTIQVSP